MAIAWEEQQEQAKMRTEADVEAARAQIPLEVRMVRIARQVFEEMWAQKMAPIRISVEDSPPLSRIQPDECTCQHRYGHREHALDCAWAPKRG